MKPDHVNITGVRRALGYQQVTASIGTAFGLTFPVLPGSGVYIGYVIIQPVGGALRWRDDGTAPTASVGMKIPDGGELNYCGDNFSAIKFIQNSGDTVTEVNITYYA